MIRSFECSNFRNVSCRNLEFARINILIGPNNSGKSNFIKALSFAANMVSGSRKETTNFLSELGRNGWNSAVDRRQEEPAYKFVWNFELTKERPVVYTLCANVGSRREENYIREESLDGAEARFGASQPYNYFRCHSSQPGSGEFSAAGMTSARNRRLRANVNKWGDLYRIGGWPQ